jgi:hypothetical protein
MSSGLYPKPQYMLISANFSKSVSTTEAVNAAGIEGLRELSGMVGNEFVTFDSRWSLASDTLCNDLVE